MQKTCDAVPGINPEMVQRLGDAGIVTCADLVAANVKEDRRAAFVSELVDDFVALVASKTDWSFLKDIRQYGLTLRMKDLF